VSFMASYGALWVLVVFLALVAIGLLREVTIMKRSLSQAGLRGDAPLVIGSRAPRFSAVDARSGRVVTSRVLDGQTAAILFLSSGCAICRHLAYSIEGLIESNSISVLAVCKGDRHDCEQFLKSLSTRVPLVLDPRSEVSELYGISSYPVAVIVDADRRIRGYGYPRDARTLQEFVASALREDGLATTVARRGAREVG
jgi:peroxiredoxin